MCLRRKGDGESTLARGSKPLKPLLRTPRRNPDLLIRESSLLFQSVPPAQRRGAHVRSLNSFMHAARQPDAR